MPVKYYLSRLWLAIAVSFYLFIPYLSRYGDKKNRFSFHWTGWDLGSLLFCIVLVGALFFLCFILVYLRGNRFARRAFTLSFITLCGIALIANISHLVKSQLKQTPTAMLSLGFFTWIFLSIVLFWFAAKQSRKIKALCMTCCFIISPLVLLFTINALGYKSFISDRGLLPVRSESGDHKVHGARNVYLFIFDEWSYQRTFINKELISEFRHLKQFADQSLVFHRVQSPWDHTEISMPSVLFQNTLRFQITTPQLGFHNDDFYPLEEEKSIFHHAQGLGFYTAMIGSAMPYGELLGDSVDFCRSTCVYKWFGTGFFDVARYHLFTGLLMLPVPLFHSQRKIITEYFFNRFQVDRINDTHELFTTIVRNQNQPTFAATHYMIPHFPYIFTRNGHKDFFAVYEAEEVSNYYGNLAYLDEKIGEIISSLKESNKYTDSLIIMTSDHGWRFDPDYDKENWWWILEKRHIPLFIKMPYQDRSIAIDTLFNTVMLGSFINKFLDGDFTREEAPLLLGKENYFAAAALD